MSRANARDQRLFVAAYPTPELSALLHHQLSRLDLPPHRKIATEQVHLTLHFVGETPEREVDRVIESVEKATRGLSPCTLDVLGLLTLPQRGRARLVAAEVSKSGSLPELQRRLVQRLARKPRPGSSDRYLPHMTLCRFRSPTRYELSPGASAIEGPGDAAAPDFSLCEVVVVRSLLRPTGAEHAPIARYKLG